jgi:Arc/MetJ-type ribon-helix-helix transcriptional regulator
MIIYHTMSTTKVAVTLQADMVKEIDRWVRQGHFANRSRAIQASLAEMMARHKRHRLIQALAKIDPRQERALAEEALTGEARWPEY